MTPQFKAGEKQAKEVRKTILPEAAKPAAMAAALDSATPASIKRDLKRAANLSKHREGLRPISTT